MASLRNSKKTCKAWYQAMGTIFMEFDGGNYRVKMEVQEVRPVKHDDLMCTYQPKGFCKFNKIK